MRKRDCDEMQRSFERERGKLRFKTLMPVIRSEAYQELTNPQKATLLKELQAEITAFAKARTLGTKRP